MGPVGTLCAFNLLAGAESSNDTVRCRIVLQRLMACGCRCLQGEKMKAAAAERERRQREEATVSKAAQGSKQLVKQLQHKRFKQVLTCVQWGSR